MANAATAAASPTSPNVLIAEAQCEANLPATGLRAQVLAEPGVAAVDFFNGALGTPTVSQLGLYDVVVVMSDCGWSDPIAFGNNLADYQDQGGTVVEAAFNWRGTGVSTLQGRWLAAGHSPYPIGAGSSDTDATLGAHDASSPLLAGVSSLFAHYRDAVSLTSGATEVAKWNDGVSAVAFKGRTVAINAYLGEYEHPPPVAWSGDFGRIIVNAAPLPSNEFGARLNGKKLLVSVTAPGSVAVADAAAPLRAAASKKKRRPLLKASSASGNPPGITVPLRLAKFAKQKLRQKGKVSVKARVTFTPTRGKANTETLKLKIKSKKK
jgi:hypothetical protein